jgi:hypothetical protein
MENEEDYTQTQEEFIQRAKEILPRLLGIYKGRITSKESYYFGKEVIGLVQNNGVLDINGVNPKFRKLKGLERKPTERSFKCYLFKDGKIYAGNIYGCTATDEEMLKNNLERNVELDWTNNLMTS